MQTFDQSLLLLYKKGYITYDEALMTASNPDDFALKVKGIQSTSDLTYEDEEKRKTSSRPGAPQKSGGAFGSSKKENEAKEYKGTSQDTDFKIDRFGDK
jgi:twitching motility protein PilT